LASLTLSGNINLASGSSLIGGSAAASALIIRNSTADAADSGVIALAAGGAITDTARGAYVNLYGNEHATQAGNILLAPGTSGSVRVSGNINLTSGTNGIFGASSAATSLRIGNTTADAADSGDIQIYAGGNNSDTARGAYVNIYGNEHATQAGNLLLQSGATGVVKINANTVLSAAFSAIGTSGATVPLLNAINTWSASQTFTATQNFNSTTAGVTNISMTCTDAGASTGPIVEFMRDSASPAANDLMGYIVFRGRSSTGAQRNYADTYVQILDPTNTAEDAQWVFRTMVAGALSGQMTLGQGLLIGSATGGDKGIGTVNAVGVYDDNVLLTCPVLQPEFLNEGKVDLPKWDALSPRGHHDIAHRFNELVQAGIDPRKPRSYVKAMFDAAALPGMPSMEDWIHGELSTGEMIGRLWLALEMLAVAWVSSQPDLKSIRH
jgi:hypothetical protein